MVEELDDADGDGAPRGRFHRVTDPVLELKEVGGAEWPASVSARPHADADAEDQRLVVRAQLGDMAAFGRLYERHRPGVQRFLSVSLDGSHTVEDAVHDVFMRAERKLATYDPVRGTLQRWVYGLAHNIAREELRRQSRLASCAPGELIEHHDARWHVAEPAVAREPIDWIRRELVPLVCHRLSADQAEAFVLVRILDYSSREAAEMMGASEVNLRAWVSRATAKLNGVPVPISANSKRHRRMAMWTLVRPLPVLCRRRFALWSPAAQTLIGRRG